MPTGDLPTCTCLRASWPPWLGASPSDCPVHHPRHFEVGTAPQGRPEPFVIGSAAPISTMGPSCLAVTAVVDRMEASARGGAVPEVAASLEQWAADLRVALREGFGPGDAC
jgi:hypothetical protein